MIVKASPELEAFYQDAMRSLQAASERHKDIKTLHVLAALGRAAGYALAMCYPDERDLAEKTVVENMRQACADVVQYVPNRKGVQQ